MAASFFDACPSVKPEMVGIMRTFKLIVFASFAVLTMAENAESQQSAATAAQIEARPPEKASANKQCPDRKQCAASSAPRSTVINIEAIPDASPEARRDPSQNQEKSAFDWVAGIAAGAGLLQGIALIWTLVYMRLTARRQLRAYVSVTAKEVLNWADKHNWLGVMFQIQNCGQTPAFQMTFDYSMSISKLAPDDPRVTDKTYEAYTALFPGDDPLPTRLFFGRTLTSSEISDVETGTRRFYIWGVMSYKDVFGTHRTAIFSFSCGGPNFAAGMHKQKGASWSWENGRYHNEPTENIRSFADSLYALP